MLEPSGKPLEQGNSNFRAAARLSVAPMMDWTDVPKNITKSIVKRLNSREVVLSLYCSAGIADFHGVVG